MSTARRFAVRSLALAALVAGAATLTAARAYAPFGGPWISIESPVNPYDASTRGALLLVHTFHHGTSIDMPMKATAEGLVDGNRRSVSLDLMKSSRTGTHAVRNQWGSKGLWTVVVTATPHGDAVGAQAVIDIAANGEVGRVQVPTRRTGDGPALRVMSASEIDRALRERARTSVATTR